MEFLWWLAGIAAVLAFIVLIICGICFHMAFYNSRKPKKDPDAYPIPEGDIYEPYREQMVAWIKEVRAMPCEEHTVTSFDGLTLRGRFYRFSDDAPIELMFPGYRGEAERDLGGGVQRCFALGHSALIVDQRACGRSEGHVISFGVNESKDCHVWINHVIRHFGPHVKIILTGISMGAATVLMAAGEELPENVVGVLADCGYSSAKEIIKKVIVDMKLPREAAYPFVRLAGKLFGGFDIEAASPVDAVKRCPVPVLLAHGEDDAYVPCEMSRQIFAACSSRKRLITVPGAGHGLCYPQDPEKYLAQLKAFWTEMGIYTLQV